MALAKSLLLEPYGINHHHRMKSHELVGLRRSDCRQGILFGLAHWDEFMDLETLKQFADTSLWLNPGYAAT